MSSTTGSDEWAYFVTIEETKKNSSLGKAIFRCKLTGQRWQSYWLIDPQTVELVWGDCRLCRPKYIHQPLSFSEAAARIVQSINTDNKKIDAEMVKRAEVFDRTIEKLIERRRTGVNLRNALNELLALGHH